MINMTLEHCFVIICNIEVAENKYVIKCVMLQLFPSNNSGDRNLIPRHNE